MHPRSLAVQPERSEAKSKAGPPTLRLRRWRGYAQSERENNPGCTRVKTAISVFTLRSASGSLSRTRERVRVRALQGSQLASAVPSPLPSPRGRGQRRKSARQQAEVGTGVSRITRQRPPQARESPRTVTR